MTQNTPKFWLDKAEEARAKAEQMQDAEARATLFEIAARYERMAQRAQGADARLMSALKKRR